MIEGIKITLLQQIEDDRGKVRFYLGHSQWDFSNRDLHNDILEIVVDGDLSGGPLNRR